jgi:putative nucleotidyltransferase with HDIG domain
MTLDATLVAALEARRPAVAAHSRRVAAYATRLASQYGLAPRTIDAIGAGALLHDIGKLLVPLRILQKAGRLTAREWGELRTHPEVGVELVDRAGLADDVCEIVLYHHERHDGLGYPDRLSGPAIQWAVRIVSVMDTFDALTSAREYRRPLSVDAARALIAREAGRRFCPWVVSGLLSMPVSLLGPGGSAGDRLYLPDGRPDPAAITATVVWTPTREPLRV